MEPQPTRASNLRPGDLIVGNGWGIATLVLHVPLGVDADGYLRITCFIEGRLGTIVATRSTLYRVIRPVTLPSSVIL